MGEQRVVRRRLKRDAWGKEMIGLFNPEGLDADDDDDDDDEEDDSLGVLLLGKEG